MKKLLVIIILLGNLKLFSQTQMPAYTTGAIQSISKDLKSNHGQLSAKVAKKFPIEKINGQYFICILAKTNPTVSLHQLKNEGWINGAFIGSILSAKIPVNIFINHFTHSMIDYIEVAEKFDPYLDLAIEDIRADSVHNGINLPQSYTGSGVLIGVVDWGFDYSHPVFYDTALQNYRVRAAWDQVRTAGPAPAGFSHGTVYEDSVSLISAEADTFSFVTDYHGTHVAGICGGAGGGTPYRGVGFGSKLLFSQMAGNAAYSLDAFQWMYNVAKADGKRLVINNSYGSQRNNPLDGTSLTSQAIETLVDSNVVFVFSAGNNAGTNFHIKKIFNSDSMRTRVGGFNYSTDYELWGQTITSWGEVGNSYSARIRVLNSSGIKIMESPWFNTGTSLPFTDTFMVYGSDTVWYSNITDAVHPLNNRPQMSFDVKAENANFKIILIAEANSGAVHFWNTRKTIFGGGNWGYAFSTYGSGYTPGDSYYGIGHPGTTSSVITVAAHNTNNSIASFSSAGPRMDEMYKPDISAPGVNIASALNSFSAETFTTVATVNFNGKDFDFMRISGTSMSGPMVTGIVSLILEARPDITPDQVKEVLQTTAYQDTYTGVLSGGSHNRWGWGKADAYNAIQASFAVEVEEIQNNSDYLIYPNPAKDILTIKNADGKTFEYEIFTLDGRSMESSSTLHDQIQLPILPSGIYLLRLTENNQVSVFKIKIL